MNKFLDTLGHYPCTAVSFSPSARERVMMDVNLCSNFPEGILGHVCLALVSSQESGWVLLETGDKSRVRDTQPLQRCLLLLVNLLSDEFNWIKNLCFSGAGERSFLKEVCYFACRVFHPLITPLLWWGTHRRWFAVPNCSYINIFFNFHPHRVLS